MSLPFLNGGLNCFTVIVALWSLPYAHAARKGGGGGGSNTDGSGTSLLFFNPVNSATFAFCVISAVFFFCQVLSALGQFIHPKVTPGAYHNQRTVGHVVMGLLFLATVCLTANYSLYAVLITYTQSDRAIDHVFTNTEENMIDFTENFATLLIIAAILVVINHQKWLHGLPSNRSTAMLKKMADAGMVLVLFILCMVIVGCQSDSHFIFSHTRRDFNIIFNVNLAFHLIATGYVVVSAFFALFQVQRAGIRDPVLNNIIRIICPMLVIRALLWLCLEIVGQLPLETLEDLRLDVVRLCQIIITGLTYLVAIGVALSMGDHPPSQMQQQQEGYAGSGYNEGKTV